MAKGMVVREQSAGPGVGPGTDVRNETGETGSSHVTLVLQAGKNFWPYPKYMRTIERS